MKSLESPINIKSIMTDYCEILIPYKGSTIAVKVDAEDYDRVKNFKWEFVRSKTKCRTTGYIKTTIGYHHTGFTSSISLHRLIMSFPSKGFVVDHINRDTLDNRKCNLRVVTHKVNSSNMTPYNRNPICGTEGISFEKLANKFSVYTYSNGVKKRHGRFKTLEEAIAAKATI